MRVPKCNPSTVGWFANTQNCKNPKISRGMPILAIHFSTRSLKLKPLGGNWQIPAMGQTDMSNLWLNRPKGRFSENKNFPQEQRWSLHLPFFMYLLLEPVYININHFTYKLFSNIYIERRRKKMCDYDFWYVSFYFIFY